MYNSISERGMSVFFQNIRTPEVISMHVLIFQRSFFFFFFEERKEFAPKHVLLRRDQNNLTGLSPLKGIRSPS